MNNNTTITNDNLLIQARSATDTELITMYIKGTNKHAMSEMKQRGIY